jgi:uncharacterized membrane protein
MADNQASAANKAEIDKIAKERLLWVIKPIGIIVLTLWVLNPSVTAHPDVQTEALLGFLLGAAFGIFVNYRVLTYYLVTRRENAREQRNRVPQEFYWGKKRETLFSK